MWPNRQRYRLFFACLLVASVILSFQTRTQAQRNFSIRIVSLDSARFPEIGVVFRAIDSAGSAVKNLGASDIDVYENDQSVEGFQVARSIDGPTHVAFVVDLGQQNNTMQAAIRRQTLLDYAQEHFRDGVDSAAIITLDNNNYGTVALSPTTSREALVRGINATNLTHDNSLATRGILGIEQAIDLLDEDTDPALAGTAIIFLTDSVYAARAGYANTLTDAQNMNAVARDRRIPIYVFHTDDDTFGPLDALVNDTGGRRIELTNSLENNQSKLSSVYQEIGDLGLVYEGGFRSVLNESGDRQVTILPLGTPLPGPAGSSATYNVSLASPTVTITTPSDGAVFTRTGSRQGATTVYDVNNIDVVAQIGDWADGHPRRIVSAELLVEDARKLVIQPEPEATRFNFVWDISDIRTEGVNTRTIQVRLRDELGLESVSRTVTVQIEVVPPPPAPAPPSSDDEPDTVTVMRTACEIDSSSQECLVSRVALYGPLVVLALLGLAFLLMFRRLSQALAVARKSEGPLSTRMSAAIKTMLGGPTAGLQEEALAHLHVITARSDLVGQVIDLGDVRQTIGRDPNLSDILLYGENDVSTVSGQHCTIQYDKLRKVFLLTDNNSTNGTTINNQRLYPDDPTELKDGDVIVLGTLVKQGAKLRFELVSTAEAPDPHRGQYSAGIETETGDDLWGGADQDEGGIPTYVDTEADVINIVPPSSRDGSESDSEDLSWMDDLE